MRKTRILFFLLFVFPLFGHAQTLDEKLKEIEDYANTVMATWKGPGMAIAIVKDDKVVNKDFWFYELELKRSK